jgi:hypothetical protein
MVEHLEMQNARRRPDERLKIETIVAALLDQWRIMRDHKAPSIRSR